MKKILFIITILLVCRTSFADLKDSSLLMFLKFEDSNGTTTCYDSSGNNKFGTMTGGIRTLGTSTSASVKFGGGIKLNGTSDFVGIPGGKVITSGDFTIIAWVYPLATTSSIKVIATQGSSTTGVTIYIGTTGNSKFLFSVDSSVGSVTANSAFNLNTWYHVAAVYKASATPKSTLYISGVLQSGGYSNSAVYGANTTTIGRSPDGNSTTYLKAIVDECKIFNRALTQSEIRQQMLGLSLED